MSDSPRKKIVFWFITLLFPFILLAFAELGLSLFGYNEKGEKLFIEYTPDRDFMVSNPEFIKRYFPSFNPRIAPNPFKKEKSENTFRIFVFGGSSAQGFPYNFYYSFADQLEQILLLNTDGLNVEVINLGMTAVNSYVIRDLSERVMPYEPDAVIIYAGHNEYYGSFGVATTQFGLVNSIGVKRLVLSLKNLRIYRLFENILKPSQEGESSDNRTLMAKVIKESNIEIGSDIYKAGIEQFSENISDVIEVFTDAKIPVYIGTIASNLKDQDPLSNNEESISAFNEGNELYDNGEFTKAREAFNTAKELDGIRFRAPDEINQKIIEFSEKEGVTLVDVQRELQGASLNGIEGDAIFIDHLHPNVQGHLLMAKEFFEELSDLKKVKESYSENGFGVPEVPSRFEQVYSNTAISRLLLGYPFKKGLTVEEELAEFNKVYYSYLNSTYVDSTAAVTARNNQFVPLALTGLINKAKERQDSATVISHYYELLKWQLNSVDLIDKGVEFAVNNRSMDTYLINIITQALNDGNADPRYMDVLSSIYLLNFELDKAGYWLNRTENVQPESVRLAYNYARYYLLRGDTVKAGNYYQKYLNLAQGN